MADTEPAAVEEVHEADLHFENTDAGASTTYPNEAGKVRKGGHLVIRGRPCKVRDGDCCGRLYPLSS